MHSLILSLSDSLVCQSVFLAVLLLWLSLLFLPSSVACLILFLTHYPSDRHSPVTLLHSLLLLFAFRPGFPIDSPFSVFFSFLFPFPSSDSQHKHSLSGSSAHCCLWCYLLLSVVFCCHCSCYLLICTLFFVLTLWLLSAQSLLTSHLLLHVPSLY